MGGSLSVEYVPNDTSQIQTRISGCGKECSGYKLAAESVKRQITTNGTSRPIRSAQRAKGSTGYSIT